MAGNNNLSDVANMHVNEVSEARLWKALDSISNELAHIKTQLNEVVRLEERVNQQDKLLSRHGHMLENHGKRIHDSELWQATQGDKKSVERLIVNVQNDLDDAIKQMNAMKSNQDVNKGQKDIGKEILKWLVGILGAIIIFKFRSP